MIQTHYEKIQEYLNMDEEISYDEFRDYYQNVIDELDANASGYEEEQVWKALFITESIMSNAEDREKRTKKKQESKKFGKMQERSRVYSQHFTKRLKEAGYSEEDINGQFEKMLEGSSEEA